ncbi:MAG: hypothetical protein ACLFN5_02705 [bacterium]
MGERFQLICSYLGENYYGWQRQLKRATVQATIEDKICSLTGQKIRIHGSGRTDRGVNALGQVAHFDLTGNCFAGKCWSDILNDSLPLDIRIVSLRAVEQSFHARHSAEWRVYGYRFLSVENTILKPELEWRFNPENWRPRLGEQVVAFLKNGIRTRQFSGSGGSNYVSEIWPLELELKHPSPDEMWLLVGARSFRYKMVRCIASALGQCLGGMLSLEKLKERLQKMDYTIKPAPAAGCYLLNVDYYQQPPESSFAVAWQRVEDFCGFDLINRVSGR